MFIIGKFLWVRVQVLLILALHSSGQGFVRPQFSFKGLSEVRLPLHSSAYWWISVPLGIDLSGNWGWLKSVVKRSLSATLSQLWEATHDPLPYEVTQHCGLFPTISKREAQIICKIILTVIIMKSHTYNVSAAIFIFFY
jgi:hypothetical protein